MNIELEVTDAELPMRASKMMVGRMVENLVANSAEALESGAKGGVVVKIDTSDEAQLRKFARISIIDSGPGMDSETLAGAFSPYFEGGGRSQTTGTGLSQVLQVVGTLGGTIEVQSKPDDGTTIEVLLPCRVEITAPSGD